MGPILCHEEHHKKPIQNYLYYYTFIHTEQPFKENLIFKKILCLLIRMTLVSRMRERIKGY